MIKTSERYKKLTDNSSEIKMNKNSNKFLSGKDNKIIEKITNENLHKDVEDSQLVKSAVPEVYVDHPTVKELLESTKKHTRVNDGEKTNDKYSLLRFLRKKQRGNSIDTNYGIWSKPQCLDVIYQTAKGLQDLDMMWVAVTEENVEYNKKYAGTNSTDYKIMKSMLEKYGEHWLGEDGQQTFTTLDFLIRPLIDNTLKEEKFEEEITFINELQDGGIQVYEFPMTNKTKYTISDWPQDRKNKILNKKTTVKKYTKILWRNVSDLFTNKNKNSSPNPPEVRGVDDGLISLVTSYVTSTQKELDGRFEPHEKSIPLELENKKGDFIHLNTYFTPLGEKFEEYVGSNIRCYNEDIFQKLFLFERKRRVALPNGTSPIVTADTLSSMVTKQITNKNYKDTIKELQTHCNVIKIMFECFDSCVDKNGIKKLTSSVGFLADLYRTIVDNINNSYDTYQVNGIFNGSNMSYKIPITYNLNNKQEFIEEFIREYNKIVSAKKKWKLDPSSLTKEENDLKTIHDYTRSFKGSALNGRKKYWDNWFKHNKESFLENGTLLIKDIKRFFDTKEVVSIIVADGYKTFDGKNISPSEAWNGKKYQGDHWEVSYKNGGFTVLWNGKGLDATQNKQKSSKNADEYLEVITQ